LQKRRNADSVRRAVAQLTLGLRLFGTACWSVSLSGAHPAQVELKEDRDPARRSDKFLTSAEAAFDNARTAYAKDDVHTGNAQLDEMMSALQNCVATLESAHKNRLYKRAEMRVATLQRRLQNLLDDISVTERGWAEQTSRKIEEIHDKLLEGAMKK
jgi:predicted lipid-binding transport protein (Tim44 family)